jgi:hypothetical protein
MPDRVTCTHTHIVHKNCIWCLLNVLDMHLDYVFLLRHQWGKRIRKRKNCEGFGHPYGRTTPNSQNSHIYIYIFSFGLNRPPSQEGGSATPHGQNLYKFLLLLFFFPFGHRGGRTTLMGGGFGHPQAGQGTDWATHFS